MLMVHVLMKGHHCYSVRKGAGSKKRGRDGRNATQAVVVKFKQSSQAWLTVHEIPKHPLQATITQRINWDHFGGEQGNATKNWGKGLENSAF